jgi:hypothetical protein
VQCNVNTPHLNEEANALMRSGLADARARDEAAVAASVARQSQ